MLYQLSYTPKSQRARSLAGPGKGRKTDMGGAGGEARARSVSRPAPPPCFAHRLLRSRAGVFRHAPGMPGRLCPPPLQMQGRECAVANDARACQVRGMSIPVDRPLIPAPRTASKLRTRLRIARGTIIAAYSCPASRGLRSRLRRAAAFGRRPDAADGVEQLGRLWLHHRRGAVQGQCGERSPALKALWLDLCGDRRRLVHGQSARRQAGDRRLPAGRLRPAGAGRAPLPVGGGGAGLKALADWIHAQGLKFGIHIVRGIPKAGGGRESADRRIGLPRRRRRRPRRDLPVGRGQLRRRRQCGRPGLLRFADRQYAAWGVDFLKVDCIADHPYRPSEIRQIGGAIAKAGRPIVLSLSPGPAASPMPRRWRASAQMWRIADDLWDGWTFPHPDPHSDFPNGVRRRLRQSRAMESPCRARTAGPMPTCCLRLAAAPSRLGRSAPVAPDARRGAHRLHPLGDRPLAADPGRQSDGAGRRRPGRCWPTREVIALDQRPGPADRHRPRRRSAARGSGCRRPRAAPTRHGRGLQPRRRGTGGRFALGGPRARQGSHAARDLWAGARLAPSARARFAVPPHGVAIFRLSARAFAP